jgi:hypothetical protein
VVVLLFVKGGFIAVCVAVACKLIALNSGEVNLSLETEEAIETVRAGCSIVRCAIGDTLR